MSSIVRKDSKDCPNLISKYRTPKIYWYQTHNAIFLRIMLMNVEKYHIKVECDTFRFSTLLDSIPYFAGIKLCGTVIAEKSSHIKYGREIKVCLIKAHKYTDWPRLQLNRDKNSFILIDPDHIIKKSWDNPYIDTKDKESFSEYKKRMNITNIMPPESSSSGTESDDENVIGYD